MRPALVLAFLALTVVPASADATSGDALLLSRPSGFDALPPAAGDSESTGTSVSASGRYVAFVSDGDGLLDGDDDHVTNVYVRDRLTGTTTLVSRDYPEPAGTRTVEAGEPSISADGNRIAFVGTVPGRKGEKDGLTARGRVGTYEQFPQIYVRDIAAGTTVLASRASGDAGAIGNDASSSPVISADGKFVAFTSSASALGGSVHFQIWRRQLDGVRATELVSRATGASGAAGNDDSNSPSISADGTRVAFATRATNLDTSGGFADDNSAFDVYLRDLGSAQTRTVSTASGSPLVEGNADSVSPAVDATATHVAFSSVASNLGSDGTANAGDVFVRTLGPGNATVLASPGANAGPGGAGAPAIDASGDLVAFSSEGPVAGDVNAGGDVFLRRLSTGTTTVASAPLAGAATGDGPSWAPALSSDGSTVGFTSAARDLTGGAEPGDFTDVFARATGGGAAAELVSRPSGDAAWPGLQNDASQLEPQAISADGSRVVFTSDADVLSGADDDRLANVFVRDTRTGETRLVSGDADSRDAVISADGRRVAFESAAGVRVIDVATGADVPVPGAGELGFSRLAIDATGTHVGFRRESDSRLVVSDLAAGTSDAVSPGAVGQFAISGDGSNVAYEASSGGVEQIVVRALPDGPEVVASRADGAGGVPGSADSVTPSLSADGRRVAFLTSAGELAPGAADSPRVVVRDLTLEATIVVGGDDDSDASAPVISADGGRVGFVSEADEAASVWVTPVGGEPGLVAPGADSVALDSDGGCAAVAASGDLIAPGSAGTVDLRHIYRVDLGGDCPLFEPAAAPPGPGTGGPVTNPPANVVPPRARDRRAPVLTRVSMLRTRFRVSSRRTAVSAQHRRARAGTAFRLTSDERASLTIRIARRGKSSTLRRAIKRGRRQIAFSGRIGRRALHPGRYRAVIRATDAAGNRSRARTLHFTVVSR